MRQLSALPDRSRPPLLGKALLPDVSAPEIITMSGGLRVILFHDPASEGVRLEIIVPAGYSWHHNPLTASFTIAQLREGTKKFQGTQLITKLDQLGSFVELQSSADYAWLTAYAHKNNTSRIIGYLASMLTEPQFGQKQFELYRKRKLIGFNTSMLRTRTLAQRAFKSHMYGQDSAYGKQVEVNDYQIISTEDLRSFHSTRYSSGKMILIAAGDICQEWLMRFDEALQSLKTENQYVSRVPVGQKGSAGLVVAEKNDALQSSIIMGRLVVGRNHPDFPALSLLNTILGGYFGSRLMTNLREDKGFTYGIYSQILIQELATQLTINADVGAEVTRHALNEIRYEMHRLQHDLVPEHELTLVKNYLLGSYAQSLDGIYNKAMRMRSLAPVGLGLEYYHQLLGSLLETDSHQVRAMAQKYLDPEKMLTVVAGNQKYAHLIEGQLHSNH